MSSLLLPFSGLVAPDPMDPKFIGDSWRTPPEVLEVVRWFATLAELGGTIALDPCTGPGALTNPLTWIELPDDGLAHDWVELAAGGLIWCNPPYSDPGPWVEKAADAGARGAHVVMLVNAMTSDGWFRWGDATCFWRGRLRFISPDGKRHMTNQHPSALPYFGPAADLFKHVFTPYGHVARA